MVKWKPRRAWQGWLLWCVATSQAGARDLSELDFIGASGMTVLTASRLDQPIMDAPNAVTVLDRATIAASGYHHLSDLFRLVPGMYAGQARGWFHNVSHTLVDEYSRRMQVLVDGRSVYLSSIGGVRWDTLPLAIDDIERIEVVRGPNAATFGANAFTGVISIVTRHPEDVAGRMLHLVGGDHGHREAWFRWAGGGEGHSHRVTLGRRDDNGFPLLVDDERSNSFSYRGEFSLRGPQTLGLQLGYLNGTRGEGSPADDMNQPHPQDVDSYFVQADYRLGISPSGELRAKVYFNHLRTRERVPVTGVVATLFGADHMQTDILSRRWHGEAQYNHDLGGGLRTSVGGFLRRDIVGSYTYFNTHDNLNVDSHGLFGHLEWRMAPAWMMNLGAFWEDVDKAGRRLSPRATLHWQPSPRHAFRVGVSRAFRNPFAYENAGHQRITLRDANGNVVLQTLPYYLASGTVEPEDMLSREIGFLGSWPEQGIDLDMRIFSERISDVINFECPSAMNGTGPKDDCKPELRNFGIEILGPPFLVPRDAFNTGSSRQQGLELQFKWRPVPGTQFLANYAYLDIDSRIQGEDDYSPRHLVGLHLMREFPGKIDLTVSYYRTSGFEPIGQGDLPGADRWDLRMAKNLDLGGSAAQLALGVQNLGKAYEEFSHGPLNLFDTRAYVHLTLDF